MIIPRATGGTDYKAQNLMRRNSRHFISSLFAATSEAL
jgi:hypothetical protein